MAFYIIPFILLKSIIGPNRHQPKESSSTSVGARVVRCGWVGLYGRPLWGASRCMGRLPHPQATIKAPNPSTQPPSLLLDPGSRLKLMSIIADDEVSRPIGPYEALPLSV